MIIGYARVSTQDQDLSSQLEQLKAAGAEKIFREKISGARSDRPELAKLIRSLQPGDIVLVTRLDRLARSTRDLLNVLDSVAKAAAAFRSLADTWADTTTPHGRLMLTVLGGLAEFERELIKSRTGEGRRRAKATGVKFGRPRLLTAHQQTEILKRRETGEPLTVLAASYRCSTKTIMRLGGMS
jgi:DNA invertase Pin-like site-specific DNA recombinase